MDDEGESACVAAIIFAEIGNGELFPFPPAVARFLLPVHCPDDDVKMINKAPVWSATANHATISRSFIEKDVFCEESFASGNEKPSSKDESELTYLTWLLP